ncbi:MAG: flagellin [Lachnospiraceae bacterium]|nr:flagellin [Lachnospiraceae bacterium]
MKVNHNMSAVITNKQLLRTEDSLSDAMERLSSGLSINHAKDNPAGMAISNKMKLQIDGLNQASRNASDGTSVLQTADGALNEVMSVVQRMRELAVQAANETNTQADLKAIQAEIDSLKEEVDRVSKDTEFNSKPLLDGNVQRRVYTENAGRVAISDAVKAGDYKVTIDSAAEQAALDADSAAFGSMSATVGASGTFSVNGSSVDILATDTYEQAFEKIRNAAEIGETAASLDGGSLSLTSNAYGEQGIVKVSISDAALAGALGFSSTDPDSAYGINASVSLGDGFSDTATAALDGNKVTVTDRDGFSLSFLADAGLADGTVIDLDVTDFGAMNIQVGSNENQILTIDIPAISSEMLYLDGVNVTTVYGASRAIDELDEAIARVSEIRSSIGAYENRLDYTVASLDETTENMTAALSRIEDADMALEMSDYTKQNVLDQAAISVLSQANDLPQQVLQLLQ